MSNFDSPESRIVDAQDALSFDNRFRRIDGFPEYHVTMNSFHQLETDILDLHDKLNGTYLDQYYVQSKPPKNEPTISLYRYESTRGFRTLAVRLKLSNRITSLRLSGEPRKLYTPESPIMATLAVQHLTRKPVNETQPLTEQTFLDVLDTIHQQMEDYPFEKHLKLIGVPSVFYRHDL